MPKLELTYLLQNALGVWLTYIIAEEYAVSEVGAQVALATALEEPRVEAALKEALWQACAYDPDFTCSDPNRNKLSLCISCTQNHAPREETDA